MFGAFHSLVGDLNHKFKLIPRVPMITGFSFPGGSNILEDHALGYSFQQVSRFIEKLSTPAICGSFFSILHHAILSSLPLFINYSSIGTASKMCSFSHLILLKLPKNIFSALVAETHVSYCYFDFK